MLARPLSPNAYELSNRSLGKTGLRGRSPPLHLAICVSSDTTWHSRATTPPADRQTQVPSHKAAYYSRTKWRCTNRLYQPEAQARISLDPSLALRVSVLRNRAR